MAKNRKQEVAIIERDRTLKEDLLSGEPSSHFYVSTRHPNLVYRPSSLIQGGDYKTTLLGALQFDVSGRPKSRPNYYVQLTLWECLDDIRLPGFEPKKEAT